MYFCTHSKQTSCVQLAGGWVLEAVLIPAGSHSVSPSKCLYIWLEIHQKSLCIGALHSLFEMKYCSHLLNWSHQGAESGKVIGQSICQWQVSITREMIVQHASAVPLNKHRFCFWLWLHGTSLFSPHSWIKMNVIHKWNISPVFGSGQTEMCIFHPQKNTITCLAYQMVL